MPSPLAGIARFPRVRLGHTLTPLDPAPNLGAELRLGLDHGQLRESAQKIVGRIDEWIAAGVRQPETRRHHSSRSEREK